MWYWNVENFNGLKEIGDKYSHLKEFKHFANYCLLKEKGIKKDALKSIEEFIIRASSQDKLKQREIALELVALSYNNQHVHQLIPFPLQRYLINVFQGWSEENNSNSTVYRWFGYVTNDYDKYRKALEIDANDQISIIELVKIKLKVVDFQTHHLSEARFIGVLNEAKQILDDSIKLINRLENKELKTGLFDDCYTYQRLINMWEEYKNEKPTLSFPEWCHTKGEKFNFGDIIYYRN